MPAAECTITPAPPDSLAAGASTSVLRRKACKDVTSCEPAQTGCTHRPACPGHVENAESGTWLFLPGLMHAAANPVCRSYMRAPVPRAVVCAQSFLLVATLLTVVPCTSPPRPQPPTCGALWAARRRCPPAAAWRGASRTRASSAMQVRGGAGKCSCRGRHVLSHPHVQ